MTAPVLFGEYTEGIEAYRKAWAAYATQRFEEAQDWVERSLRADPQSPHAWSLQGDLAYLRHDLTTAQKAWKQALKINPQLTSLTDQIEQANLELSMENQLHSITLNSLTIRVPAILSPEEAQWIVQTLLQAMEGLSSFYQYRPTRPLTILIYPPQAFYATTHLPTEVLGLFDGKIRIPISAKSEVRSLNDSEFRLQDLQFTAVLWHEYTHAVVYDVSHGKAPRWLQEGLAQVAEELAQGSSPSLRVPPEVGRSNPIARDEIASSAPVGLPRNDVPLHSLLGIAERPGEAVVMPAGQFYAASESLVQDLLETWGWDRMRLFLRTLGAGQSVEEALENVYGWDLETLERKWRSSK